MSEPDMTGMQELAEVMIRAGCEAVVGMLKDGSAVLAVGDGFHPSVLATTLREYADAIDKLRAGDEIGRVTVEYDDEEEETT